MSDSGRGGKLIPLCGLYENTSQKTGKRYFTGYFGKAKLVMFPATDPGEGEPTWTLFVAERQEKKASPAAPAGRTNPENG